MYILGQEKLCKWIDNNNLDTFPRSTMFIGPSGAGKHLLVQYISNHLKIDIIDITDKLNLDTINLIYQQVHPYLYVIDSTKISIKEENAILKLLEEPLKNAYIILLAESENSLLSTITNRCHIQYLNAYSKDDLKSFLTNENIQILEIALTPGDVIKLSNLSFNEMIELANKLVTKIHIANIPNTLSIADKMAWKDEIDKLDFNLFIRILVCQIRNYWVSNSDIKLYHLYMRTLDLVKSCNIKNIDKRSLFEKYLIDARDIMKGDLL